MLGKAHFTIGMASALTVVMPENMPAALPVIAGAAAGCLICDIDCDSPREKSDASKHRVLAMVIAVIALAMDRANWDWSRPYLVCAGIAGLALTLTFANISSHRGFSHSLLAGALEAGFLWMVFPQTVIPFITAFASHLLLDITNKKPVRLLYPVKKGFCLGWFYADRLADKICAAAGALWLVITGLTLML